MYSNLLLATKIMTLEAYLDFEQTSDVKHEFHDGKLHRMPGGTPRHNRIGGHIIREMSNFLVEKDSPCDVFTSDQKIYVPVLNKALYPDATIICGDLVYPLSNRKDIVSNPLVIVEVLSPATENYDRGDKFFYYQTIKSFSEYVLIDQSKASVEVRSLTNTEKNSWEYANYRNLDDFMELKSIGCKIPLKRIYRNVVFDPPKEIEGENIIVD